MLRPGFQLPDRKTLSTTILDDCYDVVKSQVTEKVKSIQFLNVTSDESTNINEERLLNMPFSTPEASYYYESEVMGDRRLTAEQISDIVVEKLTRFLGSSPDWSRINSMTTDTCSTMKAVWRIMEEKPMFQHTFFIPCDSRPSVGCEGPNFSSGHQTRLRCRRGGRQLFSVFPLANAILRAVQINMSKKSRALVGASMVRWRSQYKFEFVLRVEAALREWARIPMRGRKK
ncbi:hypothetical protein VTN31DRAFT_1086 [Thermomyces dupontii]|uniref:uncharacterized protein n=1 Tax=Talaromyces thermophilus TaxID=28565 RepID=UPI0037426437